MFVQMIGDYVMLVGDFVYNRYVNTFIRVGHLLIL